MEKIISIKTDSKKDSPLVGLFFVKCKMIQIWNGMSNFEN